MGTLSWKEYNEKLSTEIQYPRAIFVGESCLKRKIREVYVVDPLAQHYFAEL
jgi:hypothetical protein